MTKFKHGDRVTCEIEGKFIDDARILIDEDDDTMICYNNGEAIPNPEWFGYSAIKCAVCLPEDDIQASYDAVSLKLKEKTLDNLEVGDILVSKAVFDKSYEKKVLTICGGVYFLSGEDSFTECGGGYTIQEIREDFTLKQEEQPEELTMAELEKELGRKVKIIK